MISVNRFTSDMISAKADFRQSYDSGCLNIANMSFPLEEQYCSSSKSVKVKVTSCQSLFHHLDSFTLTVLSVINLASLSEDLIKVCIRTLRRSSKDC